MCLARGYRNLGFGEGLSCHIWVHTGILIETMKQKGRVRYSDTVAAGMRENFSCWSLANVKAELPSMCWHNGVTSRQELHYL